MLIHVLLALESAEERSRVWRLLEQPDIRLSAVEDAAALRAQLGKMDFDLLVIDSSLMGNAPEALIQSVRSLPEQPELVVLTDRENADSRATLLAQGCLAILNTSLNDDTLKAALDALVARRSEAATNRLKADRPEEQYSLGDFVSDSPAMQMFLALARKVVRSETSLLILGETGVGKERLARALHSEGPRSAGPFMAINCGALPESLLESELFGHEEGAFTGATRSRKGYFELAHRGTLLLDEIGEMPSHVQVKLLRALDDRRIYRVGGEKPIDLDVRVMAATNKDLETEMTEKRFRPDLFYRLAVVTLTIPPLRERREDIVKLLQDYLEHFRAQTGKQITSVSAEATAVLTRYAWPGNVRELVNAMERAFLLGTADEIRLEDLPLRIVAAVRGTDTVSHGGLGVETAGSLPKELLAKSLSAARKEVVAAFEARYVGALLNSANGRIRDTAHRAGINERSLYELMKRHGLRKEDFKRTRRPN
jgi:DNA-binding NtrC family response regulator